MAFIKLYRKKLEENYTFLNNIFESRNIEWGVVTKLLCGNKIYLKNLSHVKKKCMTPLVVT
jgi:predicted amino acid racemase